MLEGCTEKYPSVRIDDNTLKAFGSVQCIVNNKPAYNELVNVAYCLPTIIPETLKGYDIKYRLSKGGAGIGPYLDVWALPPMKEYKKVTRWVEV